MAEDSPRHLLDLTRRERAIFIASAAILLCALGLRWFLQSGGIWPRTDIVAIAGDVNHPIDLNTAAAAQLCWLPDVGPKTARAIVEDRDKKGSFRCLEDLMRVHNIGPGLVETIRPFVVVGPPVESEGEADDREDRSEE